MTARIDSGSAHAAVTNRARGFWAYYRRYTNTAIHAAATAALTAFGLLIFIDPSFAWLAIASYLLPPVVLYALGSDAEHDQPADTERSDETNRSTRDLTVVADGSDPAAVSQSQAAGVDADADHDGVDRDYDGPDLDFDGPDLDRDGPDRDADGPDTDSDADGSDADTDGPDLDRDG